jgi:hypothetical protein
MNVEALIFQQIVDANFDQSIATASPNNTINVVQIAAKGSGTNIGLALTPKGTGYISAQVPDGTTTGGNARGTRSVDFQTFRYANTQVASGASSFLFPGEGSIAAGGNSVAGGNQSRALSAYAFAFGNVCTAENQSTFAVGNNAYASGVNSAAFGDRSQATAKNSVAFGGLPLAYRENMLAVGTWTQFNSRGYAQGFFLPLRARTTNATPTNLIVGESAGTIINMPSGVVINCILELIGTKSDGTAIAVYTRKIRISNVAGTTSLIGSIETIGTDQAAGTALSVTANNTTDALDVTVTGIASETWNWAGFLMGVEARIS